VASPFPFSSQTRPFNQKFFFLFVSVVWRPLSSLPHRSPADAAFLCICNSGLTEGSTQAYRPTTVFGSFPRFYVFESDGPTGHPPAPPWARLMARRSLILAFPKLAHEYLASRSLLKYPECFSRMFVTFPHPQHSLKGVYRVLAMFLSPHPSSFLRRLWPSPHT